MVDDGYFQVLPAFVGNDTHTEYKSEVQKRKQKSGNNKGFFPDPCQVFSFYDNPNFIHGNIICVVGLNVLELSGSRCVFDQPNKNFIERRKYFVERLYCSTLLNQVF